VLKSLCIKTNNEKINNYLLEKLHLVNLDNIYVSHKKFKLYKNLIIHYTGDKTALFTEIVSGILADAVIEFYENRILKNIISSNYFYFTDIEQKRILDICIDMLNSCDLEDMFIKRDSILLSCIDYFADNKSLILEGFIKFRLNNYVKILDSIVDLSVNKYVIDREYNEFIDLLKIYINSKDYGSNIVHLIYTQKESILLDESKNIIELETNISNSKYLSDISFSSNDFALNSLLTLLPKIIYIHLIDNRDEFINTLELIFDNRVFICNDCSICKMYRLQKINR